MPTVYLFRGLPASGKSTEARRRVEENPTRYKRVNKDDLRAMLDNNKHTRGNEKFVLKIRDFIILSALEEGKDVIVDDTNLHPKHTEHVRKLVEGRAAVELVDFLDVDIETCIARDLKRANSVGEAVIRRMWREYLGWTPPIHGMNPELPRCILCDLDGTLALLNGRSPYDASTCDQDLLNEPVARIVRDAQERGVKVLFVSGREDKFRAPTVRFLEQHLGPDFPWELHMRRTGDMRKDSLIKREIFDNEILPRFYVDFVLDDRNQVVDMWRGLGLTCLQVNYGDF